jgi:hypothetical protein
MEVEIILAGYQLSQDVNYLNTPMKEHWYHCLEKKELTLFFS